MSIYKCNVHIVLISMHICKFNVHTILISMYIYMQIGQQLHDFMFWCIIFHE